ncbi:UNVERIFIED_CONTAM: putative pentatricopeptide repeat-containing protein [Sesamum angustifolium]|uniref:Pentatricopeptide repeat-containing protein n=1 Tax=Sesamum angustifolium TaxID=2727405 RepID=A0AAW2PTD6_9LAMI
MSKLRPEYLANLRKSVKTVLQQSSFAGAWKHQFWKDNPIYPDFDVVSANKAITLSCKTGELEHARQLFDTMPDRTVVSWNTMITGYSKWAMFPEALELISLMHRSGVKLDETTFSTSLSVCGRGQSLVCGKQIHGLVMKSGHQRFKLVGSALLYVYASCCKIGDGRRVFDELHRENELLWSLMLVGYVECDLMSEALSVFDRMPRRGVVEWTTLISGYVKSEDGCKKALELFKVMKESCEAVPNEFTLDCVARACGRLGYLWGGRVVHGLIIKSGFEYECSIGGALICLYSSCEFIDDAKKVYDNMLDRCANDSNELIGGLLKLGKIEEAELIFSNMAERNPVSYNLMIKGYVMCGRVEDSERLFHEMPVKILSSLNTMISVYAKNGEINKALELFEKAKGEGSPITWNSMISGYIENDQLENALRMYLNMRRSSISQTRSTFSVLFHACACLGSLQQGQLLHAHLAKTPLSSNVYVGTALTDMYAKCGSIADARAAFSCISSPNVAAWTALINGLAHHGLGSDAVSLFNLMLEKGITPNAATFVAVLSSCARAGLVDKGMRYFRLMKERYGMTPTVEHFTCVADLLGRSGLLNEAEELIDSMPIKADKILLISLLHASFYWMDMEVGNRVAEKMLMLYPDPSSACVIMSNMYSGSGKWGQKLKVRDFLRELGVKKDPGCSWIDVNNRTHVFSVDYRSHPNSDTIYASLETLKVNAYSFSSQLTEKHT